MVSLRIGQNDYLGSHFLETESFQTKIFGCLLLSSFTFNLYLGTNWKQLDAEVKLPKNQLQFKQTVERMWIKFEDQLNVALKTDYKYFLTIKLKEIFGRYLPLEGGLWQKCYFQIFCSAWANWPTHKISDLSDPPFMFFANNFANIWCIWSNPKTIIKFWQLGII